MTELCTDGYHVNTNVQEAAAGFFAFLRGGVGQAITEFEFLFAFKREKFLFWSIAAMLIPSEA